MSLSWVEIDLAALRHNFQQVRRRINPETRILGVVKSDAYGHGMVPVARELEAMGCHFLAVSKYWEAAELREAGLRLPVLVLLGVEPHEMQDAIRKEMRPVLYRLDHARMLSKAASALGKRAIVHVKVDTGMGRLGVPLEDLPPFLNLVRELPELSVEGILSHFAVADEADKTYSLQQLRRFREVLTLFREYGFSPLYAHISNSAGLLDFPEAQFQLVRPGIMLYGSPPSQELLHPVALEPVMALKAKVIQIKKVPQGQPIGYGRTFTTRRPSIIATLPVGYDDGYPRLMSNQGAVLLGGQRAPIVGRVSMNMITVDVTDLDRVREDDEAVLLGRQEDQIITGDDIARLCGTISYEIFCNMGRHRHRTFLNARSGE